MRTGVMELNHLPRAQLSGEDYAALERSFITREIAEAAALRRVTDVEGRELVAAGSRKGKFSGVLFPYLEPGNGRVREFRLRRDFPDLEDRDGKVREKRKYVAPPGRGNLVYFPPGTLPDWLTDASLPLVIGEGEKKCLALWRIAWEGLGEAAEKPRFLPVGLSGVWNWRGRIGKATNPDGSRSDVRGVIPDLRRIVWQGRLGIIFFDSNVRTNPDVREARRQLAGWFTAHGARVRFADLPVEDGVNGPDDAAAKHGPQYILDILRGAIPLETSQPRPVLTPDEARTIREQPYRGFLQQYEKASWAGSWLPIRACGPT
jgi:hypothetical protein